MSISSAPVHLVFKGRLRTGSFIAFARHRADRLGVGIAIGDISDDAVGMDISGAPELIDAFEMACSLGPQDCLVTDVTR